MEKYKLVIKKSAAKELQKTNKKDQSRLIEKIQSLSTEPKPIGSRKLSGEEKYRLRQGDYRILYEIKEEIITVVVVRVAHRRAAYKNL